ncbi:MAG TPA: c-type cytochrome [Rhodanobacteraceae bacterium]|nr:c-type cytochrome [Rhodanobacteraceae bacterium]
MLAALLVSALLTSTPSALPPRPARLGLCAACHGADGHASVPGAPNLAGQPVDYLAAAIRQYQQGERANPVMRGAVGSLRDADIDALARWYAAQSPCRPVAP